MENTLYYGDNLDILRRYIKDECVDLIYLDPPFNSKATYNMLFKEHSGEQSAAQFQAFEDTWTWDHSAAAAYQEIAERGGRISQAIIAFRSMLGDTDMLAYLSMMTLRLIELHRVLKETGSIYLHCDPTASHYLKIILDMIFGNTNFRNEIIWQRTRSAKKQSNFFGKTHDVILLYSKSENFMFYEQFRPYDEKYLDSHYRYYEPGTNRRYMLDNFSQQGRGPARQFLNKTIPPPEGKHWIWSQERIDEAMKNGTIVFSKNGIPRIKRYLDEVSGEYMQDIWTDIPEINSQAAERLGYPTQKPLSLLERIILSSSREGDIVLDPFAGCGTCIDASQKLNRKWIGIDITHLSITVMKRRLIDTFGKGLRFEVIGEPTSVPDAQALADNDPYQFQWWALGLVGARPVEGKKGADKGIDGRLFFHEQDGGPTKQVIFSVKAGHTGADHVRDLHGVVDRENAEIGVLITMQEPTKPMRSEAASGGIYKSPWGDHSKIQILTVQELLEGKRIDMPPVHQVNITYKRAVNPKDTTGKQKELFSD